LYDALAGCPILAVSLLLPQGWDTRSVTGKKGSSLGTLTGGVELVKQ